MCMGGGGGGGGNATAYTQKVTQDELDRANDPDRTYAKERAFQVMYGKSLPSIDEKTAITPLGKTGVTS